MGWKTVKEHYKIKHIVHIRDGELCVGSGLVSDLFSFSLKDGKYLKGSLGHVKDFGEPWSKQIWEDSISGKLLELIQQEDSFSDLKSAWTNDRERVIEKKAEKIAYPECCTDGELIYRNSHFETEQEAREDLKMSAVYRVKSIMESYRTQLEEVERRKSHAESTFIALVRGLGLEKKFSYELEEIEILRRMDKRNG